MNWDQVEGNWKQMRGKVRERWGKLTNDDLDVIRGRQTQLVGRIQERYGKARDEAENEVNDWLDEVDFDMDVAEQPRGSRRQP